MDTLRLRLSKQRQKVDSIKEGIKSRRAKIKELENEIEEMVTGLEIEQNTYNFIYNKVIKEE